MNDRPLLRIALPNKGSLAEATHAMLTEAGYKQRSDSKDLVLVDEANGVEFYYLRPRDIAVYVGERTLDLGFTGRDMLLDSGASAQEVLALGFGGTRFRFAAPGGSSWTASDLEGKRIATSYPGLLKRFFDEKGLNFKSVMLGGSVEVAPRAGLADAICDLVSTGATLEANGLKEVEVIYRSKAVLVQAPNPLNDAKQKLIDKLLPRIQGMQQARESKYIMLHAPKDKLDAITDLLPGAERPTIMQLAGDTNQVALHVVSSETLFWETMEQLKALGASSILVLPIEKMME